MTERSDWTIDTLRQHILALMEANDQRYEQRFHATQQAVETTKTTTEKRFESVNEFRSQLSDQQRTFMPRAESEVMIKAIADRLDALARIAEGNTRAIATINANSSGQQEGSRIVWGWIAGGFGLLFGIVSAIVSFLKR